MTNSLAILHQSLACLPVLLHMFVIGLEYKMVPILSRGIYVPKNSYDYGYQYAGLDDYDSDYARPILRRMETSSKIVAIFITPLLADKFGRRLAMNLITILLFVASLLTIFVPINSPLFVYPNGTTSLTRTPVADSEDLKYILCVIHAMFNLAYAMCNVVSGIYIVENCSPTLRGVIGSGTLLMFAAGSCTHHIMSIIEDLSNTSIAITNAAITAVCVFPTLYYSIETPSFLTMKGRREKAEQSLLWLSGTTSHTEVMQELQRIENTLVGEKLKRKSIRSLFSSAANVKGLFVVCSLQLGMWNYNDFKPDTILMVATEGLVQIGRLSVLEVLFILLPILFTTLVGPFVIEWIDRRSLIITGYFGIAFFYFICFLLAIVNTVPSTDLFTVAVFVCALFTCSLRLLMYSAIYAFREELLPYSVRAIGSSIGALELSISSLYQNYLQQLILDNFGIKIHFLIFAVLASLSSTIFYNFAPKPTGNTLHELQYSQSIRHVDRQLDGDLEEEITRL